LSYSFDGTNAAQVTLYYTKDLVDIDILTINDADGSDLGGGYTWTGQRKGEAVTIDAPVIAGYTVLGATRRIALADGSDVELRYRSNAESGVTVKVYAGSVSNNILLMTYAISATRDDIVTVNPVTIIIAGYE
jgi:hypothetical protein